jgi:hypothetical protein
MPNWCSNSIVITGDKDKIKKIKRVLETMDTKNDNIGVFQTLVGRDENVSSSQYNEGGAWYNSNMDRWGCKWDINWDDSNIDTDGDECITMSPQTAWSPPEGFCRLLSQQYGVDVQLEYSEPGCDFAGRLLIYGDGREEESESYQYLEGLYFIDEDLFWMEIQNNLEYEFEEDEPREVKEWLMDFPYVDKKHHNDLIEMYNDVKEEYKEREESN